jgi:outer membrane receptor protein involved in Fe transport
VAPEYLYYKELWQHDIAINYTVNDRFTIYGGVRNLWNQQPDIGSLGTPISAVGRFGYVGARVKLPKLF